MVSMQSPSSSSSPRSPKAPGGGFGGPGGVFLPTRYFFLMLVVLTALMVLQVKSLVKTDKQGTATDMLTTARVSAYQEAKPVLRNPKDQQQCRFYLAESAVAPNSGMGMFTATGLLKGDMIGFPDICIFVSDAPKKWTHLHSHSWGKRNFFGQYEGSNSRAACEGFATIFNTMPNTHINTKLISPLQQTTAGVRRYKDPGAGSITHHYGIHSEAMDVIPAGSELTINYGDWDFDPKKEYKRPSRTPEWLQEHGWCIDHIEIKHSTIEGAGRGAFVKRNLPAGTVVAPAPLQVFKDRKVFQTTLPEQLYVNYCFQPRDSTMLFYPYGPGVNLINHASSKQQQHANVRLQWSKNPLHEHELLDMERDEFLKKVVPGHIVLEVVALRDLVAGEELFLDYGSEYEAAWEEHVANWEPVPNAQSYVYPEDMDDTATLRTVKEQETDPYPSNLITMCMTTNGGSRGRSKNDRHQEWSEYGHSWAHGMVFCHILDRQIGTADTEEYTVSLHFFDENVDELMNEKNAGYDPSVPMEELYIDTKVPRRAIRWIEKPYMDDEHLQNAFRHPIMLPDELVPDSWRNAPIARKGNS